MTDSATHHSEPPDLPVSLLQRAGEPDIPYAQRVFRAGWEAGRSLSIEVIQAASQAGVEAADRALGRPSCPHQLIRRLAKELRDTEGALGVEEIGYRESAIALADEAEAWLAADPEPVAGATDDVVEAGFRCWWNDRFGSAYFGAIPLVTCIEWTQYAIARWAHRPSQLTPEPAAKPTDEDLDELCDVYNCDSYAKAAIRRALELWGRPASCPHLHQGDSGSQWCELAEQGVPHPPAITGRLPLPEECDSEGRVWMWRDETATDPPGWDLEHNAVVVEVLRIQAEGVGLGRVVRPFRWRPAASLPMEVEP